MQLITIVRALFFLFLTIDAAPLAMSDPSSIISAESESLGGAGSGNSALPGLGSNAAAGNSPTLGDASGAGQGAATPTFVNNGDILSKNNNSTILSNNPIGSGNKPNTSTNTLDDILNSNEILPISLGRP